MERVERVSRRRTDSLAGAVVTDDEGEGCLERYRFLVGIVEGPDATIDVLEI